MNNKKRQQKEVQLKLARKRCRSRNAIFGSSKTIQSSLPRTPKCGICLLIKENM